jgi:hypothetical protein
MQQLQAIQNQNALAQYQLGSAQRGDAQQNALYARLRDPNFDQANPQHLASLSQFGTPGIQAMKAITEAANARQTGQKLEGENRGLQQKEIDQIARNLSQKPDDESIQASKDIIQKSSFYSAEAKAKALAAFDRALKIPLAERGAYFGMQGATAGDTMTAATAKAGQNVTMRGQNIVAGTAADKLNFEQNKFAWEKANPGYSIQDSSTGLVAVNLKNPQDVRPISMGGQPIGPKPIFNAQSGGFITPPVAGGQPGFVPIPEIQQQKDKQAAVKALKSAGYDPETGTDTISKLIEKSTSGKLQAGAAASLAFLGITTEGKKAIASLEGTANQIATDLAGGKLGAGISNTDRDFIVAALGDVANPYKTSEERLAGWTAAKNRMVATGLVPAPGRPAAAPARNGVDTSNPLLK